MNFTAGKKGSRSAVNSFNNTWFKQLVVVNFLILGKGQIDINSLKPDTTLSFAAKS